MGLAVAECRVTRAQGEGKWGQRLEKTLAVGSRKNLHALELEQDYPQCVLVYCVRIINCPIWFDFDR